MYKNKQLNQECFTPFNKPISSYMLPERFTFPFNYEPHALCLLAARDLQNYLKNQNDWEHNFGLDDSDDSNAIGKMFGVLVVYNQKKEIGYLAAYSGKLAGRNDHKRFVPPVFNLLDEDGFYRKEEDLISEINHRIESLEQDSVYLESKKSLLNDTDFSQNILKEKRRELKRTKKDRQARREKSKEDLSPEEFETFKESLKKESLDGQFAYKRLAKEWKDRLEEKQSKVDFYENQIESLKNERKLRSAALQKKIFEQFSFLNFKGEEKSLYDIFSTTAGKVPPAGAGECSAPKLLQYAYKNKMKPLAMAEFWWGESPGLEIRKHGHFYPACRGKCEPILNHMLVGLKVDKNPMLKNPARGKTIDIVFEDDYLLLVNKPADFLSVPGKNIEDSVYSRIKKMYPEATGPLLVHRLDMSTSGLVLIAKTSEVHKNLQSQFINRSVKKQYKALLDGNITEDEGLIELPLRVDLNNRPQQMVCYDYGKPAITRWKVIERLNGNTLVNFFPITGRTHQLRVHAAHHLGLDSPIVGDDLYGKKSKRLCLHAEYIRFTHPVSGKTMRFSVDVMF